MATGMVVYSGLYNINVAPNSPNPIATARANELTRAGKIIGRSTYLNTCHSFAPNVRAASSKSSGIEDHVADML